MPTSLFASNNINLKLLRILAILLLSPLTFFAQQLTGLWTGLLSNDSNTIRKDQSFEIALTEYRGKVYGYSRSEFIVNDTLYYVVKRVKGTIDGDVCEVKDDEIIAYNFPTKLDKGVKVVSTFLRNKQDSTWFLAGKWKTNQTKKYYSVTGKVALKEEKDVTRSKIFPHLEELNLVNDVPFYKEALKVHAPTIKTELVIADKKPDPIFNPSENINTNSIAIATPATQQLKIETADSLSKSTATNKTSPNVVATNFPVIHTAEKNEQSNRKAITDKEKPNEVALNDKVFVASEIKKESKNDFPDDIINPVSKPVMTNSIAAIAPDVKEKRKETISSDLEKNKPTSVTNNSTISISPEVKKEPIKNNINSEKDIVTSNPTIKKTEGTTPLITSKEVKNPSINLNKPGTTSVAFNPQPEKNENRNLPVAKTIAQKKPVDPNAPAALVDERKSEFAQEVLFKSDSLELSLYDNGEIDGDTVSVLLNGEVILAKQGLKATAIKKTIYIPEGNTDSLVLVLYAENLGKYPPNTGLLIVHDGDDVYQVRFSADLQKNAGVIFRKKKN